MTYYSGCLEESVSISIIPLSRPKASFFCYLYSTQGVLFNYRRSGQLKIDEHIENGLIWCRRGAFSIRVYYQYLLLPAPMMNLT